MIANVKPRKAEVEVEKTIQKSSATAKQPSPVFKGEKEIRYDAAENQEGSPKVDLMRNNVKGPSLHRLGPASRMVSVHPVGNKVPGFFKNQEEEPLVNSIKSEEPRAPEHIPHPLFPKEKAKE